MSDQNHNNTTRNHDDINELKDSLSVFDLVSETVQLTKSGAEYRGLCPFHDDNNPSLIVNASKNVWHCPVCPPIRPGKIQLGGDIYDWMAAKGYTLNEAYKVLKGDLADNKIVKKTQTSPTSIKTMQWSHIQAPGPASVFTHYLNGEPDYTYRYNNKNGTVAGYVCRFENEEGKVTLPYIYAKNNISGLTEWRYLGFQNPFRPLYNADLIDANPSATIVMVEGEKCADFINEILTGDYIATTWVGGAGQVGKTDMSQLSGRTVIFWPDNDEAGRKCMTYTASTFVGKKRTLKIPADKPAHWDVADSGFNTQQLRDFLSQPVIAEYKHSDILDQLMDEIKPVNFRQLTGIEDETVKLVKRHYQICTVERVLEIATKNAWGICKNQNYLFLYNGAYWKIIEAPDFQLFLGQAAEKMGVDRFMARHYVFRVELLKQFEALGNLPTPGKLKDLVLVNFKNGTFEIGKEIQKMRAPKREDFLTYQLDFDYDPSAKAPLFETFINKVLPDIKQQMVLAEYIGYVFLKNSAIKMEKTLLLYGSGANGKSVCFEIISAMLGEDNISNYSLSSLTDKEGYYRAKIAGKLLNYGTEINGKLEADVFKQLASGEPTPARLPYGEPFMLTDYAKLMFNCNELPTSTEQTDAFFRRFIIIKFGVTIPEDEQDRSLAKKIIASELPGIFNWVMAGLTRLIAQDSFTKSDAIIKQVAKFRIDSDTVQTFMQDENFINDPTGAVSLTSLYQDYTTYCVSAGIRFHCSRKTVSERLEAAGFQKTKRNIGIVFHVRKVSQF